MGDIAELIARLEKADGPDRESDFLIFESINFPGDYFGSKIESWSRSGGAGYTVNTADGMRHLSAFNAPHFTASIDSALTLVSEGWFVTIFNQDPTLRWFCALHNNQRAKQVHSNFAFDAPEYTAPIALCIAALKARQNAP